MSSIVIELHVPDFNPAKDYYSKLGFEIVWETQPCGSSGYLVMRRGASLLCFWGGNQAIYSHKYFSKYSTQSAPGFGVEIVIQVEDLPGFYKQVQEKEISVFEPLSARPWGLEDFRLVDPYGYYLRITSEHDVCCPSYFGRQLKPPAIGEER